MSAPTTCYGCGQALETGSGVFYCDACATRQLADYLEEMRAYEAFHAFADQPILEKIKRPMESAA